MERRPEHVGPMAIALLLVPLLLISACDDAGGGGITSTPAPAPIAAPALPTYQRIADMNGDRTLHTGGVNYDVTAVRPQIDIIRDEGSSPVPSGVTIAYWAATDTYTLSLANGLPATFDPGTIRSQSDPLVARRVSTTLDNSGNRVADQSLDLVTPKTAAGTALNYLMLGDWGSGYTIGRPTHHLFVGGADTFPSDMPKTGTASYSTGVRGSAEASQAIWSLDANSSAAFQVNFETGMLVTTIRLAGVQAKNTLSFGPALSTEPTGTPGDAVREFGTLVGTGTIASNSAGFGGSFSSMLDGTPVTGTFAGAFFGPQASEMGFAFDAHAGGTAGLYAVGAVVGIKQ